MCYIFVSAFITVSVCVGVCVCVEVKVSYSILEIWRFIWTNKTSGRVTTGFSEFTLLKCHLDFALFLHHHRFCT